MTNGEFSEDLPAGGKLKVNAKSWHIHYYIAGPDLRYKGEFFDIPGNKIDDYIVAWQENFKKYLELKATIPSKSEFHSQGKMDMIIAINSYFDEGVSLTHRGISVKTEKELKNLIENYEFAKKRALEIMTFLKKL